MVRPPVKKLSPEKFFELTCSPAVKVYVGPKEKLYTLPKDLLCHYSPFFVGCFNGGFKEATEGVLLLPEDEPRYFDVLVDYMRSETALFTPIHYPMNYMPQMGLQDNTEDSLDDCIKFVKFCDKYDIHEATIAAVQSLQGLIRNQNAAAFIKPDDVSTLASVLPPDNPILRTLYRACVKRIGADYQRSKDGKGDQSAFQDMVKTDDRVALGIMRELQPKVVKENRREKTIFELPFDPEDYSDSVG